MPIPGIKASLAVYITHFHKGSWAQRRFYTSREGAGIVLSVGLEAKVTEFLNRCRYQVEPGYSQGLLQQAPREAGNMCSRRGHCSSTHGLRCSGCLPVEKVALAVVFGVLEEERLKWQRVRHTGYAGNPGYSNT